MCVQPVWVCSQSRQARTGEAKFVKAQSGQWVRSQWVRSQWMRRQWVRSQWKP